MNSAIQALHEIDDEMERWEQELECEAALLCRDVLGIEVGDIVLTESQDKSIRLEVESLNLYTYDGKILFVVSGKRFRKDGLPGKRTESIYIEVDTES